ncbi:DUF998 domain-containing protein [Flagellimonas abyssi]|uniref:DUF998 domain-containing protein n=1 Tax=Flagellimonas abyssi TaxID=2864871 RepID=A0ABS7EUH9_9FLAO|nr:DUF998 domain-containing protein [Allomuricauda abyssi]MBW8201106.1 DUF998 domain-containing protein [Allomuricauda abyssi]|tara:strand:- start:452 stop:1111 length:660 start_codon:yes stop_codon:yes gene_type:complete
MKKKTNFGSISVFSGILAIILSVIAHSINPKIDPSWQPISEASLGNNGWLMNIAFLLMALSIVSFILQSKKCYTNLGGKIGKVFLVISAIGFLLAGFFNTDPAILPQEQATTSGLIHIIGAGLSGFLIIASLPFTWVFIKNPNYKKYKIPILLMTILLWVSEICVILDMATELPKNNGNLGPNVIIGWSGRVVMLFCVLWLITISLQTKKYKNGQTENC